MNEACSTLEIMMDFTRNHPYYDLTLLVPIVLLTALAPLGLILSSKLSRNSQSRIHYFQSRLWRKNGLSNHCFTGDDDLH